MKLYGKPKTALSPGARRSWTDLDVQTLPFVELLGASERVELERLLWDDAVSEYDARFLSRYLRQLDFPLSAAFFAAEASWAVDEERHHLGFFSVGERAFGFDSALLDLRQPDFAPLEHLFGDEFSILCLFAYDELATVRGFSANLPLYDRLGPDFGRFVRLVIADEAWHYCAFLRAAIRGFPQRIADGAGVIAKIRASEGIAYGATFLLDHDDPVYQGRIFDEAARVMTAQFAKAQELLLTGGIPEESLPDGESEPHQSPGAG